MNHFPVLTSKKEGLIDITKPIENILHKSGVKQGICLAFVPHTTCGITINENADPDVCSDILKGLKIIPENGFSHSEGNSPAHIKATLIGSSVGLIIQENRLLLGTWQGIYLAEFDGPRTREVWVKIIAG